MAETGPDHAIDWPGVGMVKMHSKVRRGGKEATNGTFRSAVLASG